jgi:hypothetical protein
MSSSLPLATCHIQRPFFLPNLSIRLHPDEVKEIFNTLMEATKWRHCNNEKMTRMILQHLIDAGYKEPYKH